MTDADLAHMLGWKPAVFTCRDGTLSAVIRKIADEAARRERVACAKVCDDITTDDRVSFDWERGAADCAQAIRARGKA